MPPFIFLYGPPASGKSAVGRRLAKRLHFPFYDLDEVIERQAGQSIPEIFEAQGETGFRERESAALQGLLASSGGVIALGGGTLLRDENRQQVASSGVVVCLRAPFEVILQRLDHSGNGRPLLDGDSQARLRSLLTQRAEHYASFTLQVHNDTASLDDAIWQVQGVLGLFRVEGMGAGYDVHILSGGLADLGAALRERGLGGPLALVSDENVARFHLDPALASLHRAGYTVQSIVLPPGEANKNIAAVIRLWELFLTAGLERGSAVLALGGGVVGDLAGFAASAFLRGVRWVALPTSLLAMVDASLGGKTGVDLPQGKNLVGAFHPPSLVLADPHLLRTLPETELRNGLAEVLKHGLLGDPELFERCSQGWSAVRTDLERIVRQAVAVKVRVIQEDPYERGARASLNLGHTLGHALEQASDYRLRHGEAVAIGISAAAWLAERLGLAQSGLAGRIDAALVGLGLPTRIPPGLDRDRIRLGMGLDKKRAAGRLRLVLPQDIGSVRWGIEIDDPDRLIDLAETGG